jgi:hypothetical protein
MKYNISIINNYFANGDLALSCVKILWNKSFDSINWLLADKYLKII